MKFEEQFPSLKNDHWDEGGGFREDAVQEHCLDKQRVKKIIAKVLGICHFDGIPIIRMQDKREDRHDYFEKLRLE